MPWQASNALTSVEEEGFLRWKRLNNG